MLNSANLRRDYFHFAPQYLMSAGMERLPAVRADTFVFR
jgi:hypothetical protein